MKGAKIKVLGCGLCGSDIIKIKKETEGAVLGHEVVGHIVEIEENSRFKLGDKVVLGHHVPCFDCVYCRNENYSMCQEFKDSNITPGGFSEYIYVTERHLEHTVFKVPDNVPDIHASFTEPAACCLRAVKRANIKPNDRVLVIGLGSIGLIMGQILKYFGAEVTGSDLIPKRIELAKELGFKTEPDKDFDKIFLTAGNTATINIALNSVRDGGTILVFASVPNEEAGFQNDEIYYRELTVLGSYSPAPQDLGEALDLISKNIIKVDKLFNVYDIVDINKAIDDTCANKIIKAFVKIS